MPDEAAFRGLVEEFWFEAYHVAKYLARNELWLAKCRDWSTKQLLMRMIGWHERYARGKTQHPHVDGTRAVTSEDTWSALLGTFAAAGPAESWLALSKTTALFRQLAHDTATALQVHYPVEVDRTLAGLIASVANQSAARERSRGESTRDVG